jgi:hypothetical protein
MHADRAAKRIVDHEMRKIARIRIGRGIAVSVPELDVETENGRLCSGRAHGRARSGKAEPKRLHDQSPKDINRDVTTFGPGTQSEQMVN